MRMPVWMWVCDVCEDLSAMSTSAVKPPGIWGIVAEQDVCPHCMDEALKAVEREAQSGVALAPEQRCP